MSAWDEIDRLKKAAAEKAQRENEVWKPLPKESADAARTRRANERIANGVHPLNKRPLYPVKGMTCGTCVHLEHTSTGARRTFYKCKQFGRTHGPATDVRKKWPACDLWKEAAR